MSTVISMQGTVGANGTIVKCWEWDDTSAGSEATTGPRAKENIQI